MRINYNAIPEYRLWRNGSNKKAGSKGLPGSKIMKKILRKEIKHSVRTQRINLNKGKAEQQLEKGVLIENKNKPKQQRVTRWTTL